EERQDMPALEPAADDHVPRRVDAVDLKDRLRDIETDCRHRLHVRLPESWPPHRRSLQWHLPAGGGAVHSIRSGLTPRSEPIVEGRSVSATKIDEVPDFTP